MNLLYSCRLAWSDLSRDALCLGNSLWKISIWRMLPYQSPVKPVGGATSYRRRFILGGPLSSQQLHGPLRAVERRSLLCQVGEVSCHWHDIPEDAEGLFPFSSGRQSCGSRELMGADLYHFTSWRWIRQGNFFPKLPLPSLETSLRRGSVSGLLNNLVEEVCSADASWRSCTAHCGASCSIVGDLPPDSSASGHDGQSSVRPLSVGRWIYEGHGESSCGVTFHLPNSVFCTALSYAHGVP